MYFKENFYMFLNIINLRFFLIKINQAYKNFYGIFGLNGNTLKPKHYLMTAFQPVFSLLQ